jgi:Carboxypeptidase regulatory-like domain
MNASFSILQKVKNQFMQSSPNKSDFQVAFAPFAFTLSNDDFYFLRNNASTGVEARKYLKEQSEFAFLANSILKHPQLWKVDGDSLLYDAYRHVLDHALTVDPAVLSSDEKAQLKKARAVLYTNGGTESARYKVYKEFSARLAELDKGLIDHQGARHTLSETDTEALAKWTFELQALNQRKQDLKIEWEVKGSKSRVEAAKASFDAIVLGKTDFIERWQDARNFKMAAPNLLTDEFGVEFLSTTCVPNAICDYQAAIWKRVTLTKAEIGQLAQTFTQEVPAAVLQEFGDLQPDLDAITFEYCLLDILRPWFDERLLINRLWTLPVGSPPVSSGDASMTGQIPAYPVKLILAKNIDFQFTPLSAVNEGIKTQLRSGIRLFFGPLLLKTIPGNLPDEQIRGMQVQQLSGSELAVIARVAVPDAPSATVMQPAGRMQMLSLLNQRPQLEMRRAMHVASLQPSGVASVTSPTPVLRNTPLSLASPAPQALGTTGPTFFNAVAAASLNWPAAATSLGGGGLQVVRPTSLAQGLDVTGVPIEWSSPPTSTPIATAPPPSAAPVPDPQPTPQALTPTVQLQGRVVDTSNQAVPVTEVQVMSLANAATQSVLSLSDGSYRFPPLVCGTYQMKVRKAGFTNQEKSLTLQSDTTLDVLMQEQAMPTETFQIIGVICKRLPRLPDPLPGATYR